MADNKNLLAEKLAKARSSADHWKETANQYRRRALSSAVIRHALDRRVPTLAARLNLPSAAAREASLRAASPAYEAALGESPASFGEHVHRMQVQGLHWWMPVVNPRKGLTEGWLVKQRFPYRALTQTRELAIGGVMLDLGANVGRMSIPRVVLGDVAAAYCAEPDPLNYACLVGNVTDNGLAGHVLPDRVAIGDQDGTVILRRGRVSGSHRVLVSGETLAEGHDRVEVPALTLDNWVRRMRIDPDAVTFVKVDVQGFEVRVLRGAADLLTRRHIAWQLEVDPQHLALAGSSLSELLDMLVLRFERFIDMSGVTGVERDRPISEIHGGLAYLSGTEQNNTDILVF